MPEQHTSKRCTKCKVTKPVSEFGVDRSRKDGVGYRCKACMVAAGRVYRVAHPDKVRASQHAYCEANREVLRERNRAYQKANPDKVRESKRVYRASPAGKATAARAQKKAPLAARRAKSAVNNEIAAGRMKRANEHVCTCGKPAADWHHWSYLPEHQLDVTALCRRCHKGWHRSLIPEGL